MNSPSKNEPFIIIIFNDESNNEGGRVTIASRIAKTFTFFKNMINDTKLNIDREEYIFIAHSSCVEFVIEYILNLYNSEEEVGISSNPKKPENKFYEEADDIKCLKKRNFFRRFLTEDDGIMKLGFFIIACDYFGCYSGVVEGVMYLNAFQKNHHAKELASALKVIPTSSDKFMEKMSKEGDEADEAMKKFNDNKEYRQGHLYISRK